MTTKTDTTQDSGGTVDAERASIEHEAATRAIAAGELDTAIGLQVARAAGEAAIEIKLQEGSLTTVKTDDCLIDLETLGTTPGSIILSATAVGFNRNGEDNDRQPRIKVVFSMTQQMLAGLEPSKSTLEWYLKDRKGQIAEIIASGSCVDDLKTAITKLNAFFESIAQNNKEACVWGNDANFDVELLLELYKRTYSNEVFPFKYYKYMNVRTIKDSAEHLFGRNFFEKKDKAKNHDPEYDCQYEIYMLQKFWARVNELKSVEKEVRDARLSRIAAESIGNEHTGKGYTGS